MHRPRFSQSPYLVGSGPCGPPISFGRPNGWRGFAETSPGSDCAPACGGRQPAKGRAERVGCFVSSADIEKSVPEWRKFFIISSRDRPIPGHATSPLLTHRLDCLKLIRVAGSDRDSFLQGQLTQDIALLNPALSALFGWTTAQGRLLVVGQLFDWRDAYWLTAPAATAEALARRLRSFVLRAKVTVDLSEFVVTGLSGRELAGDLRLDGPRLPVTPLAASGTDDALAARVAGDPRRALVIAERAVADRLLSGLSTGSAADWHLADIRAGVPQILPETSDAFIPQMVNLDLIGGVSFDKGCYSGQEIVARMRHLGRIKRRMLPFRCAIPIQAPPGDPIFGPEREIGRIVSLSGAPEGTELLAVTQLEETRRPIFADKARRCELLRLDLPYSIPEFAAPGKRAST